MSEFCSKCGQVKELCICGHIAKETEIIKVRIDRRRFGKVVTKVYGLGSTEELKGLATKLKRFLACGGTIKENTIELQGEHRRKVKGFLLKEGYNEGMIDDS